MKVLVLVLRKKPWFWLWKVSCLHYCTGITMGALGARAPFLLATYSVTQNTAKNAPEHFIFTQKKNKKFLVRGHSSSSPSDTYPSSAPSTSRFWLLVRHCITATSNVCQRYCENKAPVGIFGIFGHSVTLSCVSVASSSYSQWWLTRKQRRK